MKKTLFIVVLAAIAIGVVSCKLTSSGETTFSPVPPLDVISGRIVDLPEDGANYSLALLCYGGSPDGWQELASYDPLTEEGEFALELPQSVAQKYMTLYPDALNLEKQKWVKFKVGEQDWVNFPEQPNVYAARASLRLYRNGVYFKDVVYNEETYDYDVNTKLVYSASQVRVAGEGSGKYGYTKYYLNFKKGWFWIFNNHNYSQEIEMDIYMMPDPGGLKFRLQNIVSAK